VSAVECPYEDCKKMFKYDGDYDGFTQDSQHEFECPKCEREFLATVYWDLVITNEEVKVSSETKGQE